MRKCVRFKGGRVISFFVRMSEVCPMKISLLNHSVEYVRRPGNIIVLDSSAYEVFNVHIKSAYRRSFRRRAARLREKLCSTIGNEEMSNMNCVLKYGISCKVWYLGDLLSVCKKMVDL